jgi:ABC-type multidrug transport system fused ATPase/permease subunit
VFDEATSALDNATEQALTKTIGSLHGDKTIVFIAHRLSTVQSCDQIAFLSNGRLADTGTYGELLRRNADFQKLASAAPGASAAICVAGEQAASQF